MAEEQSSDVLSQDDVRSYLFDMLAELAELARKCGETDVARQLDTLVAAHHHNLTHDERDGRSED